MAKRRAGARAGSKASNTIAFQGEPGANSDMACHAAFPYMTTLPCPTFEAAMAAVQAGKAELAIIPVENSIAGRVADLHSLLPHTSSRSSPSTSSGSSIAWWRCPASR
jgi:prephenate dehydratase